MSFSSKRILSFLADMLVKQIYSLSLSPFALALSPLNLILFLCLQLYILTRSIIGPFPFFLERVWLELSYFVEQITVIYAYKETTFHHRPYELYMTNHSCWVHYI